MSLRADTRPTCVAWCRIELIGPSGVLPDLAAVDALARLELAARRLGGSIRLLDVCEELAELLDLAGLRGEMSGEAEGGEEVGVEEGVEPGDPVA